MRSPAWLLKLVRLTRVEYFADFFITPPITLAFAIVSLAAGFSALWLAEFALGWLAWTLYEYAFHRWGLHHVAILRDVHALHHRNQKDYIAIHPLVTLALYASFWLALGFQSSAIMVGFSAGYVVYSALHTAFHYSHRLSALLPKGRRRHVAHHRFEIVNFGVTTDLWDRVFRTNY